MEDALEADNVTELDEQPPEEETVHDAITAAVDEAEGSEEEAPAPAEEAAPQAPEGEPQALEAAAPPETPSKSKPPIDWAPEVKAHWETLPQEVRDSIHAREVAVNNMMQETAQERRTAQAISGLTQAYAPVFAAEGVRDPLQGVEGLLQITATLQQGGPVQKAQRIAGLIQHYGVDIEALDNILSGNEDDNQELTAQQQQQQQIQQMIDQRMAPADQLVQQAQQIRQQQYAQQQQKTNQTIEQFAADPAYPHFEAVRTIMADFVDLAAANGEQLTLPDAYARAVASRPELAAQNVGNVAAKQRAASSIAGRGAASGGGGSPMSVYDAVSAAWDSHAG